MSLVVRATLLSSASLIAALSITPSQAFAQATCSQIGSSIECLDGTDVVATGMTDAAITPGIGLVIATAGDQTTTLNATEIFSTGGGSAFDLQAGGAVTVTMNGDVLTNGVEAHGLNVVSSGFSGTLGDISAVGEDSAGVLIDSNGAVDLAIGNIDAVGNGIWVYAYNSAIDVSAGSVTTTGQFNPGVALNSTSSISFSGQQITTDGDDSLGLYIGGGAGPVSISTSGVQTFGDRSHAVRIIAAGDVTAGLGTVETAGANAVGVWIGHSGVGTIDLTFDSVTVGEAGGVWIGGPSASVILNGGVVSSSLASSDVVRITASDVSGMLAGVTSTGAGSRAVVLIGGVSGLEIGDVSSDGTAVTVSAASQPVTLTTTGSVSSTSGTGININSGDTVDLTVNEASSVTGAVAAINVSSVSGTAIDVLGTVEGMGGGQAIAVSGGPLDLSISAGGVVSGRSTFTASDDVITNAGTFYTIGATDFAAGTDLFDNTASGTVASLNGAAMLANLEMFNNAGLMTMADGTADDSLTLAGNYFGAEGALLSIDVGSSAGGLSADQLVVLGTVSGSTDISLNLVSGVSVDPDGVVIVDAGSFDGTPFILSTSSSGLVDFAILQDGTELRLTSSANASIFDIPTMGVMTQDSWHESAEGWRSCANWRRRNGAEKPRGIAICGQAYVGEDRHGGHHRGSAFGTELDFSNRLEVDRHGAQLELGFGFAPGFSAGVTGGYERAESDLPSGSELDLEGFNIGLFAEASSANGLFAGALLKHDVYDVGIRNAGIINDADSLDARSTGIAAELGWRTGHGPASVELGTGISYVKTSFDPFQAGGMSFDDDNMESVRGRVEGRVGWEGAIAPYISAALLHEVSGDGPFEVTSGSLTNTIESDGRGTWARLEAGAELGGRASVGAWANFGDVRGWGVRAGLRF